MSLTTTLPSTTRSDLQVRNRPEGRYAQRPLSGAIHQVDARVQAVNDENFALALEFATEMGATLQILKEEKERLTEENNLLEKQIVQLNIAHKKECKSLLKNTKAEVQAISDKINRLIQRL